MIRRNVINSLSDDELSLLLYYTNVCQPPGFGIEVTESILTSYRKDKLLQLCDAQKVKLNPEGIDIHDTLVAKLNGTFIEKSESDITATPGGAVAEQRDS